MVIAAKIPRNAAIVKPDHGINFPRSPPKLQKIAAITIYKGPKFDILMFEIITDIFYECYSYFMITNLK